MKEIVCVHKWSNLGEAYEEEIVFFIKRCDRCLDVWRGLDEEPRTVIGRIE